MKSQYCFLGWVVFTAWGALKMDEFKSYLQIKLELMQQWCEGAEMTASYEDGLHNFSREMRSELIELEATIMNWEKIGG